jgi:hypothetical protein
MQGESNKYVYSTNIHSYAAVKWSIATSGRQLNRTGKIAHPIPLLINIFVAGAAM